MYKKILVPLDGSTLAEAALPHAEAIAKSEGAEIILFRIPTMPATEFFAREPSIAVRIQQEEEVVAKKYFDTKLNELKKEKIQASIIML